MSDKGTVDVARLRELLGDAPGHATYYHDGLLCHALRNAAPALLDAYEERDALRAECSRYRAERDSAIKQLRRLQANVEAGVFVDATPDAEYPIRILMGHLAPHESTFVTDNLVGLDPSSQIIVEMNKASAERAAILRSAIHTLGALAKDGSP